MPKDGEGVTWKVVHTPQWGGCAVVEEDAPIVEEAAPCGYGCCKGCGRGGYAPRLCEMGEDERMHFKNVIENVERGSEYGSECGDSGYRLEELCEGCYMRVY